jgi:hypothetical protein
MFYSCLLIGHSPPQAICYYIRAVQGDQIGQFLANWATFESSLRMKLPKEMVTFWATFCFSIFYHFQCHYLFQNMVDGWYYKFSKVVVLDI